MKRGSPITLDDLAKRLDVSRVTVSKALRGHRDISAKTVKRVREVAEELGYSPNIIARSLSSKRSNMLGLVVPRVANFFFGSIIEAVYDKAFGNNYETILTVSQENPEREKKHLQTLVSMRVDGIIVSISQNTRDMEIFSWIRKVGVPLLFLDRLPEPPLPGFNSVTVDDKDGAFKAVAQAIKVGYRKLACLGGSVDTNIGKHRLQGFRLALKQHGLPIKREWIINCGFGKEDGYKGFMDLHRGGNMPEFIFAMTYPVAQGIYEAAKELGLQIPHDIDLICFGDSDVSKLISPALSCVEQPSYELGEKATDLMFKTITDRKRTVDQHIVLPTKLVLRETCSGRNTVVSRRQAS